MEEKFLGDYRVLREIGVSALGNTLLAEHRFIKKLYMLHALPLEMSQDKDFMERFEEEVAKLALLESPHILKIHNVSCSEGIYFLVTDAMVHGEHPLIHLGQYLSEKKEPFSEEELLRLVAQIAEALDYAHSKGIVHTALKLSNVLIDKSQTQPQLVISEFGLAKIISPARIVANTFFAMAEDLCQIKENREGLFYPLNLTAEKLPELNKVFLEGFSFLAPEQKRGEAGGVSADTFAFGVLVYYLIAKKYPEGIFAMPSEIFPDYRLDWDGLINECLRAESNRRPLHLVPALERKRHKPAAWQKNISLSFEEGAQQLTKEEEKPSNPIVEQMKGSSLRSPPLPQLDKETSLLKPIIQRSTEKVVQAAPSFEMVSAPTALLNEIKEKSADNDAYAQQLSAMLNRDPIVTQYQPEKKENRLTEPLQTEMSIIKGGEFIRGSNSGNRDEMPSHKIILDSFALDIHPVTNEQFLRFLEFMNGEKDENYNDLIRLKDSRLSRSGGKLCIESGYAKHPVVGVTWYGAAGYAKWAGKRLPTEAEWEVAVRGGLVGFDYPTGDHIEKGQANFFSSDTTPVMSFVPNPYGLYDMVGNVYEWCQDWYGYNYYETSLHEPNNPKGPLQGVYRVLRGGCWKSLQEDMRCSHRHRNNPGTVNSTCGFRCAADVS